MWKRFLASSLDVSVSLRDFTNFISIKEIQDELEEIRKRHC